MALSATIVLSTLAVAAAEDHDHHGESHDNSHHESHEMAGMPGMHSNTTMEPSPISMHSGHHHSRTSILDDPNLEPQQRAYWEQYDTTTFLTAEAPHKSFLYAHITLTVASWVFLYPVALAFSVAKSPFYLIALTTQFATVLLALFTLTVYGATAPANLYPNNLYAKISIVMFFISTTHWVAAVIKELANWAVASQGRPMDGAEYVLANLNASSRPARGQFIRQSQDSGLGMNNSSSTTDDEREDEVDGLEDTEDMRLYPQSSSPAAESFETLPKNKLLGRIMANKKVYSAVSTFGSAAKVVFAILNRPLFVIGLSYLLVGIVTCFRLGISNNIYNILAHFIKGSIFFLYGILTLQRYLGAFADRGMAWNITPGSALDPARSTIKSKKNQGNPLARERQSARFGLRILSHFRLPTMEFVECSLIFIYGCSNVFMEHLGNRDGKWSHKDLQHVSIAFMYFGGGLCGLLVESTWIRRLVNRTISTSNNDQDDDLNSGLHGSISINPFPAFIVFWTGLLMSQHEQALPLSTSIHMQWGYLLSSGAVFRFGTYVLMLLSPPKSTVPSRPLTELVTSFCLLCGGLVFIQSNSETVEAMVYRGLDSMFTLNVNVGVTALIMSWIMVVMALKAWATKRQARLSFENPA